MEAELLQFVKRAENAELEILKLVSELKALEDNRDIRATEGAGGTTVIKQDANKDEKGKFVWINWGVNKKSVGR